jgi:hypothetical protein
MFKSTQTNTASYIKDSKYVFFCEIKETVDGKEKKFRYEVEREIGDDLKIISEKNFYHFY